MFSADCPERNNQKQIYYLDVATNDPPKLLPQQAANRQLEDMSFSPDGGKMTLMAMPVRK